MAKTKTKTKVEEPIVEEVEDSPEVVETVEATPIVFGVVTNCTRLYIRKKPAKTDDSADVVCIVNAGTKLDIDETYKNKSWCKVMTPDGKEGFCMKEFITIK